MHPYKQVDFSKCTFAKKFDFSVCLQLSRACCVGIRQGCEVPQARHASTIIRKAPDQDEVRLSVSKLHLRWILTGGAEFWMVSYYSCWKGVIRVAKEKVLGTTNPAQHLNAYVPANLFGATVFHRETALLYVAALAFSAVLPRQLAPKLDCIHQAWQPKKIPRAMSYSVVHQLLWGMPPRSLGM